MSFPTGQRTGLRPGRLRLGPALGSALPTLVAAGLVCAGAADAALLPVPNGSFETPATLFVDTNLDSWERTPRPPDYDETGGFLWSQLTGIFKNTPAGSADHILNCDGQQALWLFAVPGVGIFQDAASRDWNDPEPGGAFAVRFTEGRSYTLTVGVIAGGGGMLEGTPLDLSLTYLNDAGERVAVATTRVVNGPGPANRNVLVDHSVSVPVVRASDPWAGRPLGIRMLSTVEEAGAGGYWDLDHVRLLEIREPALAGIALSGDRVRVEVEGEPGFVVDLLEGTDPGEPAASWTVSATATNTTGRATFDLPVGSESGRFLRARQRP